MEVNYEKLLQQSNQIKNHIKAEVASLDTSILTAKPKPDAWSALEVIDHLSRVLDKYLDNFAKAINEAPDLGSHEKIKMQRTLLGRISIYSQKPKANKRKFKMKTFDFFQPIHKPEQTNEIINEFLEAKERFNALIRQARLKNLKGVKVPTALGEKVRFYVPECFEFILAHEERHMVQLEEAIQSAK